MPATAAATVAVFLVMSYMPPPPPPPPRPLLRPEKLMRPAGVERNGGGRQKNQTTEAIPSKGRKKEKEREDVDVEGEIATELRFMSDQDWSWLALPVPGMQSLTFRKYVQGGSSGRGTLFVDIKFKVLSQFKLLILKCNSQFEVNKRLFATRWATLCTIACTCIQMSRIVVQNFTFYIPCDDALPTLFLFGVTPSTLSLFLLESSFVGIEDLRRPFFSRVGERRSECFSSWPPIRRY